MFPALRVVGDVISRQPALPETFVLGGKQHLRGDLLQGEENMSVIEVWKQRVAAHRAQSQNVRACTVQGLERLADGADNPEATNVR
jgi:hypothetical protein